ncbi:RidA family protein [Parvularcula sp. ZS-1/3]|uniref:RidA family protein n=1 Tax=Parvularcula mediterranea TaxID=2732508 RepID=A0A7Y3RKY0_9PROT|nr:RidA family protein [Parvularcula mediterranea]NNU15977.1 RidA family protein [Parvularcula mediterranea]
MKTRSIDPTPSLEHFGLSHAVEVSGGARTLYLSGQTSTGPEGEPLHPGDLVAQFKLAWSNLKDTLSAADMGPINVVRLNIYTTDVQGFMAKAEELVPIWAADGIRPSCTLLEVSALFDPTLLVELEATAVGD